MSDESNTTDPQVESPPEGTEPVSREPFPRRVNVGQDVQSVMEKLARDVLPLHNALQRAVEGLPDGTGLDSLGRQARLLARIADQQLGMSPVVLARVQQSLAQTYALAPKDYLATAQLFEERHEHLRSSLEAIVSRVPAAFSFTEPCLASYQLALGDVAGVMEGVLAGLPTSIPPVLQAMVAREAGVEPEAVAEWVRELLREESEAYDEGALLHDEGLEAAERRSEVRGFINGLTPMERLSLVLILLPFLLDVLGFVHGVHSDGQQAEFNRHLLQIQQEGLQVAKDQLEAEQRQEEAARRLADELEALVEYLSEAPRASLEGVAVKDAAVRTVPQGMAKPTARVAAGQALRVLRSDGKWFLVEFLDTRTASPHEGWLYHRNLRIE